MSDSIKVFNNLSDENLHFESKEEFDRYYKKNKEIIDKMSTRALNMKISIDGFKLGRLKKELTLFPITGALGKRLGAISDAKLNDSSTEINIDNSMGESLVELKLDNISERLKKLEQLINLILKQTQY